MAKKPLSTLRLLMRILKRSRPSEVNRFVDDARNLGLVDDVELAVADDVDVGLIELAETAALCALTAVYLADLEAAEREGQLAVVLRDVLRERNGEVKSAAKGRCRPW